MACGAENDLSKRVSAWLVGCFSLDGWTAQSIGSPMCLPLACSRLEGRKKDTRLGFRVRTFAPSTRSACHRWCFQERKTMEEHFKTEQQLSEEQLQAITGGCSQCDVDLARMNLKLTTAQLQYQVSLLAQQAADRSRTVRERELHQQAVDFHQQQAANLAQEAETIKQGVR